MQPFWWHGTLLETPRAGAPPIPVTTQQTERVRVEVYSLLGQRVLTALDEPVAGGAPRPVSIDTQALASTWCG